MVAPITPELALIDPELAAAARARLPEPGAFRPAWSTRPEQAIPCSPVRQRDTTAAARARTRRRHHGTLAVVGALVVSAAAIALGVTHPGSRDGAKRAETERATSSRTVAPGWTFAWPDVPGAQTYRITIMRGDRRVLETTTAASSLELPTSLAFPPGRYTLSATAHRAGSSGPTGRPVIEETFVVAPL